MTTLNDQVINMAKLLESHTPYAHVPRDPWNRGYRWVQRRDLSRYQSEDGFRHFSLIVLSQRPVGMGGTSYKTYEATAELAVQYPLGHLAVRVDEYFAAEVDLVRRLFEPPDNYIDTLVRSVSHDDSAVEDFDDTSLFFVHHFILVFDEAV